VCLQTLSRTVVFFICFSFLCVAIEIKEKGKHIIIYMAFTKGRFLCMITDEQPH
jgi:hypothetical protein